MLSLLSFVFKFGSAHNILWDSFLPAISEDQGPARPTKIAFPGSTQASECLCQKYCDRKSTMLIPLPPWRLKATSLPEGPRLQMRPQLPTQLCRTQHHSYRPCSAMRSQTRARRSSKQGRCAGAVISGRGSPTSTSQ